MIIEFGYNVASVCAHQSPEFSWCYLFILESLG